MIETSGDRTAATLPRLARSSVKGTRFAPLLRSALDRRPGCASLLRLLSAARIADEVKFQMIEKVEGPMVGLSAMKKVNIMTKKVTKTEADKRVAGEDRAVNIGIPADEAQCVAETAIDALQQLLTLERVKKVSGEDEDGEQFEEERVVNTLGFTLGSVCATLVWKIDAQMNGPKVPSATNTVGIMNPCNRFGIPMLEQDIRRTMSQLQSGEDVQDLLDQKIAALEGTQARYAHLGMVRDALDAAACKLLGENYQPQRNSNAPGLKRGAVVGQTADQKAAAARVQSVLDRTAALTNA